MIHTVRTLLFFCISLTLFLSVHHDAWAMEEDQGTPDSSRPFLPVRGAGGLDDSDIKISMSRDITNLLKNKAATLSLTDSEEYLVADLRNARRAVKGAKYWVYTFTAASGLVGLVLSSKVLDGDPTLKQIASIVVSATSAAAVFATKMNDTNTTKAENLSKRIEDLLHDKLTAIEEDLQTKRQLEHPLTPLEKGNLRADIRRRLENHSEAYKDGCRGFWQSIFCCFRSHRRSAPKYS